MTDAGASHAFEGMVVEEVVAGMDSASSGDVDEGVSVTVLEDVESVAERSAVKVDSESSGEYVEVDVGDDKVEVGVDERE